MPSSNSSSSVGGCEQYKRSNGMFIYALLDHVEELKSRNVLLQSQLISQTFFIERFSDRDHDIAYYTGFSTYHTSKHFDTTWRRNLTTVLLVRSGNKSWWHMCNYQSRMKMKPMDEFSCAQMRLCLGLQIADLGFRFGISPASVSRIFVTWIKFFFFFFFEFKAIDFQPV